MIAGATAVLTVAGVMMGNGTPGTTVQRAAGIQEMAVMALDGAVDGAVVAGASAMIVIAGAMMVNETPGTTVQRAAGVQEIAMRALDGAVDRAVVAGATTMRAVAAPKTVNGTPGNTVQRATGAQSSRDGRGRSRGQAVIAGGTAVIAKAAAVMAIAVANSHVTRDKSQAFHGRDCDVHEGGREHYRLSTECCEPLMEP